MKTRCTLLIAFLMLTVLPAAARAQDNDHPLTWDECVALAAKKNPELASSSRAVEAGQAVYYGSFNGFLPQLTLSNSYTDSNAFGGSSVLGGASGSGAYHWQAQGTVSLTIWSAGQVANIKSASAGLAQAQAGLRLASSTLRFNLRQAFAQLLFAEKNMEASQSILSMRRKSAQLVELRYNSGRESKGNMMRSKAQYVQAQADVDQAGREMVSARTLLNRQLGMDDFLPMAVTGTLETRPPPDLPKDLPSLLAGRPDVAVQEAVLRSAKAGVGQAWSSAWPSLSLIYTRSVLGPDEFPSFQYNWTFTGVLTYPLFGGGPTATYFAVSAARRNEERAEQDFRSVRNQAVVDLENSWASFAGSVDQVKVQTALLEAARQRNNEADIRYESGLLTYDNWEIIASDRINQERQAIQAQLNASNAEAAWDKATGRALGE